ncbi:uncharacterized protein LOC128389885 [Panonychus citri]|uniref:uncharacterized protein LOC128389885 n=1 Tax=Panonychus citri TaxID=50023 RepID=UPI0023072D9B|nr:uncharacterized protein LOC128389885 [Panonychus citri]
MFSTPYSVTIVSPIGIFILINIIVIASISSDRSNQCYAELINPLFIEWFRSAQLPPSRKIRQYVKAELAPKEPVMDILAMEIAMEITTEATTQTTMTTITETEAETTATVTESTTVKELNVYSLLVEIDSLRRDLAQCRTALAQATSNATFENVELSSIQQGPVYEQAKIGPMWVNPR